MKKVIGIISAAVVAFTSLTNIYGASKMVTGSINSISVKGNIDCDGKNIKAYVTTSFNPIINYKGISLYTRYVENDDVKYKKWYDSTSNAYSTTLTVSDTFREVLGTSVTYVVRTSNGDKLQLCDKIGNI